MTEKKVATEVCEQQFAQWLDSMGLSHKADEQAERMTAEDLSSFRAAEGIVLRAMENGSLVVTERGLEFTPVMSEEKSTLVFPEPSGAVIMAQDRFTKEQQAAKTYATLAEWTGSQPKRFAKMLSRDLKVCTTILSLVFG
jgi:hypothetical protein